MKIKCCVDILVIILKLKFVEFYPPHMYTCFQYLMNKKSFVSNFMQSLSFPTSDFSHQCSPHTFFVFLHTLCLNLWPIVNYVDCLITSITLTYLLKPQKNYLLYYVLYYYIHRIARF